MYSIFIITRHVRKGKVHGVPRKFISVCLALTVGRKQLHEFKKKKSFLFLLLVLHHNIMYAAVQSHELLNLKYFNVICAPSTDSLKWRDHLLLPMLTV